jgi:hypothetical protein
MKGDGNRGDSPLFALKKKATENLPVAEMDSIEVSKGDRAPRCVLGPKTQVADNLHALNP